MRMARASCLQHWRGSFFEMGVGACSTRSLGPRQRMVAARQHDVDERSRIHAMSDSVIDALAARAFSASRRHTSLEMNFSMDFPAE